MDIFKNISWHYSYKVCGYQKRRNKNRKKGRGKSQRNDANLTAKCHEGSEVKVEGTESERVYLS